MINEITPIHQRVAVNLAYLSGAVLMAQFSSAVAKTLDLGLVYLAITDNLHTAIDA